MLLTVLMAFAGAQTAWALALGNISLTPYITYGDGLSSSNVTIKATTLKYDGSELETLTLTDGSQATFTNNTNYATKIRIAVTSSEALTVTYSGVNNLTQSGTDCTFKASNDNSYTINITVSINNTYTVHFEDNTNQDLGSMADQVFTVGVAQALTANTFTHISSLYYFSGWNTKANGSGTSYKDKEVVTDIAAAGETITLYAQWKIINPSNPTPTYNSHIVHFDANGGEGTMVSQSFSIDESKNLSPCTFTRDGYSFTGWNTKADGTGTSYSDQQNISLAENITLYAQWKLVDLYVNGDTYTINTAAGWGEFCDLLDNNAKNFFTGKTVKLGYDIEISRMAGANGKDFTGTYDGQKHTLTFNYTTDAENAAPFQYVENATIQDLRVAGTITTSNKFAAGFIAQQYGTVTIENCRSSVIIKSSQGGDGTHGGFVAVNNNGTLTIKGCVFDGKLLTTGTTATTKCGGFVGYRKNTVTVTNSLYTPAAIKSGETEISSECATFVRNGSAGSKCYYTCALGDAQGALPRSITAGDSYVTISAIDLCGNTTSYDFSGITAYDNGGLTYGGAKYYGNGDQVSLTLSHTNRDGFVFNGYRANNVAIDGSGNPYLLTMPNADVAITAIWVVLPDFAIRGDGAGTSANPYKITNADDLKDLAIYVNGTGIYSNGITETKAHDCSGVYFQQNYPITLTGDWTPIGIGSHYFKGHYNGGDNTISGLTVSGSYKSAGLFGNTYYNSSQCVLENIIVKDCNIDVSGTADSDAGGIVGYASDYTLISNCRVSGTIKAHKSAGGIAGYLWTVTNGHISKISQCFTDVTVAATTKGKLLGRGAGGDANYDPSVFNSKTSHYHADGSGVTAFGQGADNTYSVPVYAVKGAPSGVTVAETNASVTFIDTPYFAEGATTTLTVDDANTLFKTFSVSGATYHLDSDKSATVTFGSSDVTVTATVTDPAHFADNGDGSYTIRTATGWGVFCDLLKENDKGYFTGKTVKLDANISVTTMAGTSSKPFTGIFDGQKYKLTVSYQNTDDNAMTAPFSYVDGATIRNLVVDGSITGSNYRAAGFIGETGTTKSRITNCMSSLSISSGRYTGGFSIGGNVAIEGCVFCGTINGSARSGGFVGYSHSALTITNSLFAPKSGSSISGGTFYYNGSAGTLTNCYYTEALGTKQGLGYNFTTAPANIGTAGEAYSVSGITAYTRGLLYGGRYYMTPEAVSLADNATNDVAGINGYFADVTLSGRTLYKDGKWNTLCLPFSVGDEEAESGHELDGTPLEGATLMTLGNSPACNTGFDATNGTLNLDFLPAKTVEPGVAYIVKWPIPGGMTAEDFAAAYAANPDAYDIHDPVFTAVTVTNDTPAAHATTSQDGYLSFVGTYSAVGIYTSPATALYLGAANKLYWPSTEGYTVNAFRAYFQLNNGLTCGDPTNPNAARAITINFGDGNATQTGICHTDLTDLTDHADAWYDMQGRKLNGQPTKKGLYIHNGNKVVIK